MSGRTQQQRMRGLRDGYDHVSHARGLLETAGNPFTATSDPVGHQQTIDLARVHAELALTQAVHDLTDVLSTVWGEVSRELVMWRAARQGNGADPAKGGGKV